MSYKQRNLVIFSNVLFFLEVHKVMLQPNHDSLDVMDLEVAVLPTCQILFHLFYVS